MSTIVNDVKSFELFKYLKILLSLIVNEFTEGIVFFYHEINNIKYAKILQG